MSAGLSEPSLSEKLNIDNYLKDIYTKRQHLQDAISELNPQIQLLENELCPKKTPFDYGDVSERSSTPVEDLNSDRRLSVIPESDSSSLPDCDSNIGFSDIETAPTVHPGALGQHTTAGHSQTGMY